MYPVGFLFGLSFDTASSIAILAISAIAKRDSNGKGIPPADVIVLPLLFTAGMTLIDSVDSILMLYSYTAFPEGSFTLFEKRTPEANQEEDFDELPTASGSAGSEPPVVKTNVRETEDNADNATTRVALQVKQNAMSGLSIILTLMSILVAFSISLITIMGLVGDNCTQCKKAAEAPDGGGIAGRWWRGWARANTNSGYIGAAIVGGFVAVVCMWYGAKWLSRIRRSRRVQEGARED